MGARVREEVDQESGEVVAMTAVKEIDFDALVKKADAKTKAILNLKDEEFDEYVDDFWKPQDPERKDEPVLKGAYLGFQQVGKFRQHMVRTAHPTRKGQLFTRRVNGTKLLNKDLENAPGGFEIGTGGAIAIEMPGVVINYFGTGKNGEGQKLHNFKARWQKDTL